MAIAALEPTYSNVPETTAKTKEELGMDQFLTILVAQLQNQDPLNPMEGTDFTKELAQFSALEQAYKSNQNLSDIKDVLSTQQYGDVLEYIGKTVKIDDDTILVKGGETDSSSYLLGDRAEVSVYIYDEKGLEVRRIYNDWQDAGEYDIEWDGRDNAGNLVEDGTYQFEVEARDAQAQIVPHYRYFKGEVSGVTYDGGMPYLIIGDNLVTIGNIVEVSGPTVEETE